MSDNERPRRYTNLLQCLRANATLLRHGPRLLALLLGRSIDAGFRERLMLAVTEVNQCAWCSWFHTKAALAEDLSPQEVKELLAGQYDHVPEDQLPAVLFAQHWAERRGMPDPDTLQAFQRHYGERTQDTILLALEFINTMNYTVKGVEAFLARLKFWKRPAGAGQFR